MRANVKIDLSGQTFGRLTVKEQADDHITPSGQHQTMWLCVCTCGNTTVTRGASLRQGTTTSCGCWAVERVDHTGRRYGQLVITAPAPDHVTSGGLRAAQWYARCDCGREVTVYARDLTRRTGSSKTCCPDCSREGLVLQLTGRTFGRWRVLGRAENRPDRPGSYWLVECSCPARGRAVLRGNVLTAGQSASCGCLAREAAAARVKAFVSYRTMHQRLKMWRGRAADQQCVDCDEAAAQWSYVGDCAQEVVETEGNWRRHYCLHEDHFVPRCMADHLAYDAALRRARKAMAG